jgi:hypothetical protein
MVFYTGKIVLALNNPTVVVLTDRNDLDEQLFDTFANCKQLLRQDPVMAENRDHLKKLLKVAGGWNKYYGKFFRWFSCKIKKGLCNSFVCYARRSKEKFHMVQGIPFLTKVKVADNFRKN